MVGLSAYLFYRRLRREGKSIWEAMRSPLFEGRSVEISLLGGMASLRLGSPTHVTAIEYGGNGGRPALEGPGVMRIREIEALGDLLDKKLITPQEFADAKKKILER